MTMPKAVLRFVVNQPCTQFRANRNLVSICNGKVNIKGQIILTWLKDHGDAEGRTKALCEQYVVVLGALARHDEADDVKQAANEDQPLVAEPVLECANHRALRRRLQRQDVPWRTGRVRVMRTMPYKKNTCSEGIQAMVLGSWSFSNSVW
jgi:hypothetical protein